jgi:signal transduction histidine kinase
MKFWDFIKEKAPFTITYLIGNALILLFFYFKFGSASEIVYPMELSVFVYIIYMVYAWIQYCKLHEDLVILKKAGGYLMSHPSPVEKQVNQCINDIHNHYGDEISEINARQVKESRLMSAWFHNMKTPISVNEILLQRFQVDEITKDELIQGMEEENKKLIEYLDGLIHFKRLQEFEKDYQPESINLANEIKNIINQNKKLFIYNKVFPVLKDCDSDAYVLSDRKWNEVLINQIISNAVKYSTLDNGSDTTNRGTNNDNQSTKKVYFSVTTQEERIALYITDEGVGIPKADIERVFEPFFTGENGRLCQRSSGIGLYFCKEICRMLGQTIEISSQEGHGTTVKITYLSKL